MRAVKQGPVKELFFALVFLWSLVPAAGQQNPADLILLLDTSASMSGSYREVRDYITGPFLKEYLHPGDTFHLIAFSARPRLEIARRIEGRGDLETVIGRMFLLYPLEPDSDIAGALIYLERYLSELSPSKPKKVILVSDGDTDGESPEGIQDLIAETKNRLTGHGLVFDFVKVPLAAPVTRTAAPAARPPAPVPSVPASPPVPQLSAPPPAGDAGTALPEPSPAPPLPIPLPSIPSPPIPPVSEEPVSPPAPAAQQIPQTETPVSEKPERASIVPPDPAQRPGPLVFLGFPALAILCLAVFLLGRYLQGSPNRALAWAADISGKPPRPGGQPVMLRLFVEDQNTLIGNRNIHTVKPGLNFTIGGGKSDFLIFLVPIPFRIADLRYKGGSCLLIPRKPEYFPDTGSLPVKDCTGKTIRVVSDKSYELFIRIELCEDPLMVLNRLMDSVRIPALP
jgi:hypothetical protein